MSVNVVECIIKTATDYWNQKCDGMKREKSVLYRISSDNPNQCQLQFIIMKFGVKFIELVSGRIFFSLFWLKLIFNGKWLAGEDKIEAN